MSLPSIRATYGVPAKRGGRVEYTGGAKPVQGVIVGAAGAYLRVRLDRDFAPGFRARRFHPIWAMRYLPAGLSIEDSRAEMRALSHALGDRILLAK